MNITETPQPKAKAKGYFNTGDQHNAQEWAALIIANINDSHVRAWVASVIAWDLENTQDFQALDFLMAGYSIDKGRGLKTQVLIDALNSIGYQFAEERCALEEDKLAATGRRIGPGMDRDIERTWSQKVHYPSVQEVANG